MTPVSAALLLAAWAGVPVTLPRGQDSADWQEALMLAGLESGPPAEGPWVIVMETESGEWWLVVRRQDTSVDRVRIEPPHRQADREEIAFLASSLLMPVATKPAVAPTKVVAPPPKATVARPPPPPPVVLPPPPEEVVVPPPPPAPVVTERVPSTAFLGASASGAAFLAGGVGGQAAIGGQLDWVSAQRRIVALSADWLAPAELTLAAGTQEVHRVDISGSLGAESLGGLRWMLGGGASVRSVAEVGGATSHGVLPVVRGAVQQPVRVAARTYMMPTVWFTADLVQTRIYAEGADTVRLPGLGGGVGVAVRQRQAVGRGAG